MYLEGLSRQPAAPHPAPDGAGRAKVFQARAHGRQSKESGPQQHEAVVQTEMLQVDIVESEFTM